MPKLIDGQVAILNQSDGGWEQMFTVVIFYALVAMLAMGVFPFCISAWRLRGRRRDEDRARLESQAAAPAEETPSALAAKELSGDAALQAFGDALNLKAAEANKHAKYVTAFTIALCRARGLPHDRVRIIARGAFLHDIGKVSLPENIVHKPAALTPEETGIMREHCYNGYQMLKKIPDLEEASVMVYSHHEKWDGTGYPRGLRGEEIPLGARIFAVADTLEAITSGRPYRPAETLAAAQREIKLQSGRQFDPSVVELFLSMPDQIWDDMREEIDSDQ